MNKPHVFASTVTVLIGFFVCQAAKAQTTWYVDDGCSPPGDGSQGDPFCTISEGIAAAANGDTVLLGAGTYVGDGNRDLNFGGKLITVRGESGAQSCIIDCGGTESAPHLAFVFNSGETSVARLVGLTIRNGYEFDNGGAVRCLNNSSPTIESCTFTGNHSLANGGAVHTNGASPTIQDCQFSSNYSQGHGGGVHCTKSSALIQRCTFTGNSAIEGGGIMTSNDPPNMQGFPIISDCVITGNTTTGSGGGITAEGHPTIRNCTITGNSSKWGGGIMGNDGNRTIINCRITGNYASVTGGGLYFNDTQYGDNQVKLYNTLVSGNEAAVGGIGGFHREGNLALPISAVIQNCIFWDNLPDQPGGEISHKSPAPCCYPHF